MSDNCIVEDESMANFVAFCRFKQKGVQVNFPNEKTDRKSRQLLQSNRFFFPVFYFFFFEENERTLRMPCVYSPNILAHGLQVCSLFLFIYYPLQVRK